MLYLQIQQLKLKVNNVIYKKYTLQIVKSLKIQLKILRPDQNFNKSKNRPQIGHLRTDLRGERKTIQLYNYGSLKCVPSCPNYMQINVQNGNQKQCVDRCSGYVQENICVNKCPADSYSRVGDSYVCQAKCDKVYVQNPYNKLKQCFNECPSSYRYLVGKECKDSLNKAGQTNIALIVVPVVAGEVVLSVLALCFYKNKKQNGATKIAKKQKVNVNMPASMTYV
ncbi:Growth_factor receptor cysteine-rich domain superfamily [Hexamita inflata]|uniref:Growth factor receptor cysteine-rich domain superfamily n=1 Tax=Hexamita inflata TaxID=28002 RepID=A0AA86QJZ2_9EUKA|nr:Growth factor receptor cysteine-rich domain superfamily [Hexamita inflata]